MTTVGELTPDHLVISCHHKEGTGIKWNSKTGRCSVCESIHPNEFVNYLKKGFLTKGWLWVGLNNSKSRKKPETCTISEGITFTMDHLRDMPIVWLKDNRRLIAETTGVVFYWRNEIFRWKRITKALSISHGHVLTEAEKEILESVLKKVEEVED